MSHSHSHSHGPAGEPSTQASGGAARITVIGAIANVLLAAFKGVAGVVGGSAVMVADAVHSLSDLVSDVIVLLSLRLASKPPDEDHPYGHGRFETVGTAVVALFLIAVAVGIGWDAWGRLGAPSVPGSIALVAAAVSIVVKEVLYQITARVGRRLNSSLLIANAWHHRSDSLSSVLAFAAILGARMGYPILDPIAATLVAALIARVGVGLLLDSVREVTDTTLDQDVLIKLNEGIKGLSGVVDVHELRARTMGPRVLVDLHVEVDGSTTVSDGHQVAERVRHFVLASDLQVSEVLVHIDPEPDHTMNPPSVISRPREELRQEVRRVASAMDDVDEVTHVLAHYLGGRVGVQVHITLDPEMRVSEAAVVAKSLRAALEALPDIDNADIHLELDDHAHAEMPPDLEHLTRA